MAWIRDAVGISLSAQAVAVVSILATYFARPLFWFPYSSRGLEMDMAWNRDVVGISISAAALAVVLIVTIYFARPLLCLPLSRRVPRLERGIAKEKKEEKDEEEEADVAAEGKTEEKEEDEEGGIAWILNAFNSFQASLNSPAPTPLPRNVIKKLDLLKLNDFVYELCKPSGRPSLEIVFFHGFQLGGSKETFATTWLSGNGSELWPNWITEFSPEARILLVSYDGSATKKDSGGRTDMYVTCENLVQSLTDHAAQVGQDGCPVVLVGHSLGGLVMKEILLQANKVLSLDKLENPNFRVLSFLENVKQLFYYSCPHNGTRLADNIKLPKGQLFKLLTTLNKKAARRNEEFRHLRVKFKWGAYSIVEQLPANLGSLGSQVVVEEASARHDTDDYYTAHADHFSVCRPTSTSDSSFCKLRDVIERTVREDVRGHQITFSTALVDLNDQINRVKGRLRTAQHLAICGIGGIGKTTLAKAVYNAISGNFEYTSFVSEVKKLVGENVSTEDLQAEILKNLYHKGRRRETKWDRLEGKRVLIILDDVEYESQVFVMPETDRGVCFFADESRVLVTSRNKRIVSSKDFEVLEAECLGDEASRKLLCYHAFKEERAPGPYEGHVEKFITKCGGLPLALEVTGKYLYKQKEDLWGDALKRLSLAKPLGGGKADGLWSIFEVIYDSLQEEEQEMFLDIAACYIDEELEEVKRVWSCCDWVTTPNAGWQNLVDIGFVTLHGQHMWMHEVLRDFGFSKANPGDFQSYSRVCFKNITQLPTWPFKQGTPAVKILKIVVADLHQLWSNEPVIDIERLRGLENLRVLSLERVRLRGALNLLPQNLEFFRMRRCTWSAESFQSQDDFSFRNGKTGWYSTLGESSSRQLGQHPSLRHLELLRCFQSSPAQPTRSTQFPNNIFEHLRALKYVRMEGNDGFLISLPESLWELPAIETLELHDLLLRGLPEALGQLLALKRLDVVDCSPMNSIPNSLAQLPVLEYLNTDHWARVPALPSNLEELRALLRESSQQQHIPDNLGQLPDLRNLNLSECREAALPDTLGLLQGLRQLEISDCYSLRTLPDSLGRISSLEHFRIRDCKKLETLPNTVWQLQNLRFLKISGCGELLALPNTLGLLQGLRQLEIYDCDSLKTLPESFGHIRSLEHVWIAGCKRLEALPNTIGQLQNLRFLHVSRCGELVALPDTLGLLQGLRELEIFSCDSLKTLPDSLGQIRSLGYVRINSCKTLEALPNTIGQLKNLGFLHISDCGELVALPNTLGLFQGLRKFETFGCDSLKTLPESFGHIRSLECIRIAGCKKLEALPNTIGQLQNLRFLHMSICKELVALPNTLGLLQSLRELEIFDCDSLKTLPDSLGHIRSLEYIRIHSCKKLEALPNTIGRLQNLGFLHISECRQLKALPDTLGLLQGLRQLEIFDCENLETLPNSLRQLRGLRNLNIQGCIRLRRQAWVSWPVSNIF